MKTREQETCESRILRRVEEYCREHTLLDRGMRLVVGVSGGADSICLLYLLRQLSKLYELQLTAVHVNHGIRGAEADRDEQFVEQLCTRWGVNYRVFHASVPELSRQWQATEEEAGRLLRYHCFRVVCEEEDAERIAVAHHMEDLAETVLMNLARGSGLQGLAAMEPLHQEVIRPLLCLRRSEIEELLLEAGLSWCEDSTNQENRYLRNRIRRELLPWMSRELNEQLVPHLAQTAKLAGEADRYFKEQAERFALQGMVLEDGWLSIHLEALREEAAVLWAYIFRLAWDRLNEAVAAQQSPLPLQKPEARLEQLHIEQLSRLARQEVGTRLSLPLQREAWLQYSELCMGIRTPVQEEKAEITISVFPYDKSQKIPQNTCVNWFDYDKISRSIQLRRRRSGDVICVQAPDHRKKLKDYLIDAKIPARERDSLWLLACGQDILWIPGCRMSEAYKLTPESRMVLEVRRNRQDGGK